MSLRRPIVIALVSSVALAGLVTATGASGASPTNMHPRAVTSSAATYAIIGSAAFPSGAQTVGVAVNSQDDTVYVTDQDRDVVYVVNGTNMDDSTTKTVGDQPFGIAVNQLDDTVYVVNKGTNPTLTRINGATLTDDTLGATLSGALSVAVNQEDDTVYVIRNGATANLTTVRGSTFTIDGTAKNLVDQPGLIAVNDADDTVYAPGNSGGSGSGLVNILSGRSLDDSVRVGPSAKYSAVAVNQLDDTIYVGVANSPAALRVINGRSTDDSSLLTMPKYTGLPVPPEWADCGSSVCTTRIAVDQSDDTVYAVFRNYSALSIINGRNTDDSATMLVTGGVAVAVDDTGTNRGFIYVTGSTTLQVIAPGVSAAKSVDSGPAGTPVAITVSVPNIAPTFKLGSGTVQSVKFGGVSGLSLSQDPLDDKKWNLTAPPSVSGIVNVSVTFKGNQSVDVGTFTFTTPASAPTITSVTPSSGPTTGGTSVTITGANLSGATSVTFGGTAGVITANTATSITVTTPAGAAGAVNVAVTTPGGTATSAGAFTYGSPAPPPPPPIFPPGPPLNVTAVAGDGQATVSWAPPTSMGDFPITEYEVRSAPGFWPCNVAVPTTSCTVTGLENGTSYTFTVRAKSSAGWGSESSPSNAVTPRPPTILITGSRDRADDRFIRVQGTTTDLVGKQVTPYVRFPGQLNYTAGIGVQTVAADGTFSWSRKTGKRTYVYFAHEEVRSNTVVITAR